MLKNLENDGELNEDRTHEEVIDQRRAHLSVVSKKSG